MPPASSGRRKSVRLGACAITVPLERTRRLPHAQLRVGVYERDGGSPDTAYEALPI